MKKNYSIALKRKAHFKSDRPKGVWFKENGTRWEDDDEISLREKRIQTFLDRMQEEDTLIVECLTKLNRPIKFL